MANRVQWLVEYTAAVVVANGGSGGGGRWGEERSQETVVNDNAKEHISSNGKGLHL